MGINNISIENAGARGSLPANIQIGRGGGVGREDRQGGRKDKEASFIPFRGDSIAISSGSGGGTGISRDPVRSRVSPAGSRLPVEETRRESGEKISSATVCEAQRVRITTGRVVREERDIGPYTIHVNESAMKRYEQAGSFRNWFPTTFEITV